MRMDHPYKWTRRMSGVGLLVFLVAGWLAGGGHGYVAPLIIGFPWMTICRLWADNISPLFILVGLLQYPLYGFMIDKTENLGRSILWAMLLLLSHFALAIVILLIGGSNWG